MPSDLLTEVLIKKAKPKDRQYKMADGRGMYLLITPAGKKYWRMKYRYSGKEKVYSIGVYPEVKLADARKERDRAKKLLKKHQDPVESRREEKRQVAVNHENVFEVVAREWHEQKKEAWSEDHAKQVLKSLENEVFPHIGSRPIAEIDAPTIIEVVRKVEKRGALDVASRILQRIKAVFRYAIISKIPGVLVNPAADLSEILKSRPVIHRPALAENDIPDFFERLNNYDGHEATKLALELVILTFVRSSELRGARWEEFNFDRLEWRIPAERMKMNKEHIVPLSRQSVAVLEKLKPLTAKHDLLFPGQNKRDVPISENTLLYAMYRMGYHSRATVHGFRATASTILNENGFNSDVIERQLAHYERNKVRAAYHRSEYLADRKDMMQWWGDFLDGKRELKQDIDS
ncbi:MAG: tyrosine-type recombinase/integrase [Gammaproteobacteria bacterium]|nr:tyrosine-type recombinase/integrase [Gammaproteobacteria bacterium]